MHESQHQFFNTQGRHEGNSFQRCWQSAADQLEFMERQKRKKVGGGGKMKHQGCENVETVWGLFSPLLLARVMRRNHLGDPWRLLKSISHKRFRQGTRSRFKSFNFKPLILPPRCCFTRHRVIVRNGESGTCVRVRACTRVCALITRSKNNGQE